MREFQIADVAAFTKLQPAFQFFKGKGITVLFLIYIDKLHRSAFSSRSGIQRRCEKRRQNHIDSIACGGLHISGGKLPVFFTENRNLIPVCNTIRMKPFRMDESLLRKAGIQAFQNKSTAVEDCAVFFGNGDCKIVGTGRQGTFRRNGDPEAPPLPRQQSDIRYAGIKGIRIKAGCGPQHKIIPVRKNGKLAGSQAYLSYNNIIGQSSRQLDPSFKGERAFPAIGGLKGKTLIKEHVGAGIFSLRLEGFIRKNFLQRTDGE